MKFRFSLLSSLIYLLLLISSTSQAQIPDKTLISWIQLDQPPAFIVKGNKDKGLLIMCKHVYKII